MDYQTFNGGQQQHQQHQQHQPPQASFGGFAAPAPAHPPQNTLPPQQAAFQQQPGQPFPYGQQPFPNAQQPFPGAAGMVGHGPGSSSSSSSGPPMNMMQHQPMQPAGGMQRGERVTCAHRCRPIVSCRRRLSNRRRVLC
jgi:hypothetical protein